MTPDDPQAVETFTAGTIGPKGARTFYIQTVSDQGELFTFKLEKQQVGALAEYLSSLLEGLGAIEFTSSGDDIELIEPFEERWVVGSIGVAWNEASQTVIVGIEELQLDADEPLPPESAHFRIHPAQAAAFVRRAEALINAGRPPCPFCGTPLNDDTGWCPCHN